MSHIIFKTNTLKQEHDCIASTGRDLAWLKKHSIIFYLPEKSLKEEYDLAVYNKFKNKIEKEWRKREDNFFEKIKMLFNIKLTPKFKVQITNYGSLGSYNPDARLVLINMHSDRDIINTIKHEIVHMIVEPYVQKFKLKHWDKENLVENLLMSFVKDYEIMNYDNKKD